jgi:hypothetical protein
MAKNISKEAISYELKRLYMYLYFRLPAHMRYISVPKNSYPIHRVGRVTIVAFDTNLSKEVLYVDPGRWNLRDVLRGLSWLGIAKKVDSSLMCQWTHRGFERIDGIWCRLNKDQNIYYFDLKEYGVLAVDFNSIKE